MIQLTHDPRRVAFAKGEYSPEKKKKGIRETYILLRTHRISEH